MCVSPLITGPGRLQGLSVRDSVCVRGQADSNGPGRKCNVLGASIRKKTGKRRCGLCVAWVGRWQCACAHGARSVPCDDDHEQKHGRASLPVTDSRMLPFSLQRSTKILKFFTFCEKII